MNYKAKGYLNYNGTLFKPDQKVVINDSSVADQLLSLGIITTLVGETEPELKQPEPKSKKKTAPPVTETDTKVEVKVETTAEDQVTLGI